MRLPRWIHKVYAKLFGYYWLACPLCGQFFGGHEECGILMTSKTEGETVCVNCRYLAETINAGTWKSLIY
jgi:hypothetical protein